MRTRVQLTLPLTLLIFVEDGGYQRIYSLHRDEDAAHVVLAALLRERWHRVAGRNLGAGTTVPAAAEHLSVEETLAFYARAMEHIDDPRTCDTWGTEELPVELDLAALALGMLRQAAFGPVG